MNLKEGEWMNLRGFEGNVCVVYYKAFGDESEWI